ncbi:MAG: ribose-5-phosphate isomerase RpiA [Methanobacteriota archaeon]
MNAESWKIKAATEAAKLVRDDMVIGLGSGTTVAKIITTISELGSIATFVASSSSSQKLAEKCGLNLSSLDVHPKLDMTIDGADEVDSNFDMIKGRGGAHTREKILVSATKKLVIVVDRTKLVKSLGHRFPVPVEVLPFAPKYTMRMLAGLGKPTLRTLAGDIPMITDNGNYLVDLKFRKISNVAYLEQHINTLPGVIDNGLFAGVADVVLVGYEGGCKVLRDKKSFLTFLNR